LTVQNRLYLDHAATTPVLPEARTAVAQALDRWANPSSPHADGRASRAALEQARRDIADALGWRHDIILTSGATEAIAIAAARARVAGRSFSATEHDAVGAAMGSEATILPVDEAGAVDLPQLRAALSRGPTLVAVQQVNNETGVVQPVADVGRVCRERGIHLHCDAVQAAGKIDIDVNLLAADTLSLSAHKIHAPKGIGALYVRRGLTLEPLIAGGAQERRRRAGTENVPLAAAFGAAATLAADANVRPIIASLRNRFESALRQSLDVVIHGADTERVVNTSSVMFRGADAEGIAIALDLEGIAISTGSACSSGRVEPSGVLLAMGLTPEEAKSTVRVSLSRFTTGEEIERVVEVLLRVVPRCLRSS